MKMAITARNAELDALGARLDGGFLKIYSGTQPDHPEDAESGTLLATLEFGSPAFASADQGMIVANALVEETDAPATGDAAWFRCTESGGAAVLDGSIGANDSFDLVLGTTSIQAHAQVSISLFEIQLPESP